MSDALGHKQIHALKEPAQIDLRNNQLVAERIRQNSDLNYNARLSITGGIRRFSVSF
jgi:hypothetical protein